LPQRRAIRWGRFPEESKRERKIATVPKITVEISKLSQAKSVRNIGS
jgi:hypothetical protein